MIKKYIIYVKKLKPKQRFGELHAPRKRAPCRPHSLREAGSPVRPARPDEDSGVAASKALQLQAGAVQGFISDLCIQNIPPPGHPITS